jgi:plasmid maintenance system antidote protein VapI
MIIRIYTNGRMAEIILEEASEVPDAIDLARMLIVHGATAAKIVKSKSVTGEPAINIAHNVKVNTNVKT